MQSKGLDFLQPIWSMIYSSEGLGKEINQNGNWVWEFGYGLNLSESDVEVSYTRYINKMKPPQNQKPTDKTIYEAVEAGLTPGNFF